MFSAFFVQRPKFALVISIVLTLAGLLSIYNLPVTEYPAISPPSINVTGVSVNPARSIGPALFAGTTAIAQLWLFIVAPIIGAVAAGALFASGLLDAEAEETSD